MVLPALMATFAAIVPPVTHVTSVPAMIPFAAALPKVASATGAVSDTMIVATPNFAPLLAFTLPVNVPVFAPAVNKPEEASMVPPLFTMLHAGVIDMALPDPSVPDAVNCDVPPGGRSCGFGETTMFESEFGAITSRFPHAATRVVTRGLYGSVRLFGDARDI
ncbi:MAG: hypothetical protein JJD97_01395 [Gemmatimonadaceae bacterium]|nr:hypothetical protein [Gemmatimonadaceae bacterium]